MSWADPDNGISEVEENPDPEEDSDLPDRQHQDGDVEGARGEEEGPEDDLGMAQAQVASISAESSQGASVNPENNQGALVNHENGHDARQADDAVAAAEHDDANSVSVDTGVVNDANNSVGSIEVETDSRDEEGSVLPENAPVRESDSGTVGEGDSFEQDEETAAPECENEVRHEACSESDRQLSCSESDRQLYQYQEQLPESTGEAPAPHDVAGNVSQHEAGEQQVVPGAHNIDRGAAGDNVENVTCDNVHPQQEVSNDSCKFRGDVEIANNLDDAPEAEVGDINNGAICEEEDNLQLNVTQADSDVHQISQGRSVPHAEVATQQADMEVDTVNGTNSINIPRNDSSEIGAGLVQDIQAPECDRGSGPQHSVTENNGSENLQQAQPVEAIADSQPLCDNSLSEDQPAAPAAEGGECKSSENVLQENISAEAQVEAGEQQSKSQSAAAPQGLVVSGSESETLSENPVVFSGGPSKTTTPDSGLGHSLPTQSISSSSPSHTSSQLPADHSDSLQSSPDSSLHDQASSAQTINQQTLTNPSIPALQVDSSSSPDSGKDNIGSKPNVNGTSSDNGIPSVKEPSGTSPVHKPVPKDTSPRSKSSSPAGSQHSSPSKSSAALSQALALDAQLYERELALALQSDDEDDLLHELDAALLSRSPRTSPHRSAQERSEKAQKVAHKNDGRQDLNGLQPSFDVRQLQEHNRQLLEQLRIRDTEISRLTRERDAQREELTHARTQVADLHKKATTSPGSNADDVYLPQIKELEKTIAQQQSEIKMLKEKLVSHDSAAKRAVTTLQNELKSRVDQVTKMYEDTLKEKDMMVVRFAEAEAKNMEAKRIAERSETKVKEAMRDKENMMNALKAAKADKQKAVTNFELKCAEIGNLHKELEKMKEAVNSSDYRIKWFQNKLKDELEAHKETKATAEKTATKLREAREETEIIRKECQAIVKRYQESEEYKSNSLDKELKMKETELRTQMQERNDTEEIHQMTKKELDSLKAQHKDTIEEAKTYRDKVQCLEAERQQNHMLIENYQEIMQRQKTENADLKSKVSSFATIEEDYKRAQDMIQSLDKDIAELKVSNRDLQKDMESCRERESKLLTLQSELSRTNALLRSENTNLSNKASTLTGEVEKLKMEVQELETTVKDLTDKYEEEKTKRKEEVEKIGATLAERTQECNDFKQKWEDEIDSSKTLKRRHANNVKDLTRQLHQVKRKLETLEGKGDGGSMGSRTNSNGSLNSVENSTTHQAPANQPPVQEFPVITEQVEVDKQVLIERIVRLQKSHARKNEKLEFLGEHIQQLLEEIKKKNKIIQSYALREEAGALSSEDMDANKAEAQKEMQTLLSRKGGIMASVYSVHQQDGNMTLELSLQINKKLQAVLEDTLLKNITLKESLDTLGEEIARLSQENRKLQLHLQEIEQH